MKKLTIEDLIEEAKRNYSEYMISKTLTYYVECFDDTPFLLYEEYSESWDLCRVLESYADWTPAQNFLEDEDYKDYRNAKEAINELLSIIESYIDDEKLDRFYVYKNTSDYKNAKYYTLEDSVIEFKSYFQDHIIVFDNHINLEAIINNRTEDYSDEKVFEKIKEKYIERIYTAKKIRDLTLEEAEKIMRSYYENINEEFDGTDYNRTTDYKKLDVEELFI